MKDASLATTHTADSNAEIEVTEKVSAGAHHYRAFVGPVDKYDLVGATQFNLLTLLGLREHTIIC